MYPNGVLFVIFMFTILFCFHPLLNDSKIRLPETALIWRSIVAIFLITLFAVFLFIHNIEGNSQFNDYRPFLFFRLHSEERLILSRITDCSISENASMMWLRTFAITGGW